MFTNKIKTNKGRLRKANYPSAFCLGRDVQGEFLFGIQSQFIGKSLHPERYGFLPIAIVHP